jgi:hypothetical protein
MRVPKQLRKVNLNEGEHMRRTTIVLACAMIAPLAFAQTRTTKTQQATTTEPATTQMTTSNTIGTVVSFTPGQKVVVPATSIVIQSSPDVKPITYMLGKKVRYVDKDGKAIDPSLIRGGTRVQLEFDRKGAIKRVIVVERE